MQHLALECPEYEDVGTAIISVKVECSWEVQLSPGIKAFFLSLEIFSSARLVLFS